MMQENIMINQQENNSIKLVYFKFPKQEKKLYIHKGMTIGETVSMYPETVQVMQDNGIHCVGCHVSHWETLEQGFKGHYGMADDKLNMFIGQLNDAVDSVRNKEAKKE